MVQLIIASNHLVCRGCKVIDSSMIGRFDPTSVSGAFWDNLADLASLSLDGLVLRSLAERARGSLGQSCCSVSLHVTSLKMRLATPI